MPKVYTFQRFQFPLILATAFLDILGIAFLIPILPFLIRDYGMSGAWVGYTLAIYSMGMFLGGVPFWEAFRQVRSEENSHIDQFF